MPYPPAVVRHRLLSLTGTVTLAALVLTAPASAETLLSGGDAPLIVQGNACVGVACASGAEPQRSFVVRNHDTPAIRLDQSGTGFAPYTWDVAGNEANFFVRDVTAGNILTFRIMPGSRSNGIVLDGSNVGFGTSDPTKGLDVRGSNGSAGLNVVETAAAVEPRSLADLTNNGPVQLRMADSAAGVGWTMATAANGTMALTPEGPGALPSLVLSDSGATTVRGNLSAGGTLQQTADPARQTGVEAVAATSVVDAIRTLPIERFGLDGEAAGVQHLAPNGAAFRAAFGLGGSDTQLAPGDVGTVALAGVKAVLNGEAESDPRVAPLTSRVDDLEDQVGGIDERIAGLERSDGGSGPAVHGLAAQLNGLDGRIGSAEHVQHGHERRIRELEDQATRADTRFERTSRVQRRLRGQVSSLRSENARLKQRLDAIEAAIAKRR